MKNISRRLARLERAAGIHQANLRSDQQRADDEAFRVAYLALRQSLDGPHRLANAAELAQRIRADTMTEADQVLLASLPPCPPGAEAVALAMAAALASV